MKKVLILIMLIALPSITFGQNTPSTAIDTKTAVETSIEVKDTKDVKAKEILSFEAKAQVMNLNHEKSNDLISIKAYRKSLQIKVKPIKNC